MATRTVVSGVTQSLWMRVSLLAALPALIACSGGQSDSDEPTAGASSSTAAGAAASPSGGSVATPPGSGGTGVSVSGGGGGSVTNPGTTAGSTAAGEGGSAGTAVAGSTAAGAGAGGEPGSAGSAGSAGPSAECGGARAQGHFQLEDLDRGLVAVRGEGGNYLGWRMLGYEYDAAKPEALAYNVYRDGAKVATVTDSTNYQDSGAGADAMYSVSAVIDGAECARSGAVKAWAAQYLTIPLEPPPAGSGYSYTSGTTRESNGAANDASPGDVDGDGDYELILKWDPSNAQDNSKAGTTGPVFIDAYTLEGKRLWRMNLGRNVRAGAHYTQFIVYDFDGDGKAEVALRTAPGTQDGTGAFLSKGPAATDDDAADFRNGDGYVLSGPEYLTVFEGATGKELATVNFEIARGTVNAWGDAYGNRVDRFLASAGFVSDAGGNGAGSGRPAILMARGYYTRATVTAWSFRDGELKRLWTADSGKSGSGALAGQGAHSMVVADVDGDKAQEIIYGAAMIQSDGSFGCATGLGHGDALHVTDLVPSRPGLEVFMPHEETTKRIWDVRDAATCAIIQQSSATGSDNGRGVAADIVVSNPGAEMWSAADTDLRACATGASLGAKPSMANFLIYWDGDELRELEDGTTIRKGNGTELLSCSQCMSNNNTKSTPTLTADLLGDWREEIVWRTPNSNALRVYTTTAVTQRRIYTLMHDPQYRMQITSEQTAYNQPPHVGFELGAGMKAPPAVDMHVR